jgi:rod shape-determining protein MreD
MTISAYLVPPLLALVAIVQSTVAWRIGFFGGVPNLVLLVVVAWTLLRGAREGIMAGLSGGLMLDALSGGPFGAASVGLLMVAVVTGMAEANLSRSVPFLPYVAISVSTLLFSVVQLAALDLAGHMVLWGIITWYIVLPTLLVNTVYMVPIYMLMGRYRLLLGPRPLE